MTIKQVCYYWDKIEKCAVNCVGLLQIIFLFYYYKYSSFITANHQYKFIIT